MSELIKTSNYPVSQVEYSAEYKDKLCGVCSYTPENDGDRLALTTEQIDAVSIGTK